jgi:hypothetical protein
MGGTTSSVQLQQQPLQQQQQMQQQEHKVCHPFQQPFNFPEFCCVLIIRELCRKSHVETAHMRRSCKREFAGKSSW